MPEDQTEAVAGALTNTMPNTRRKVCLPATSSPVRSHRPSARPICTKLSICTLYNLAATVAVADAATATTVNFGYTHSLARSLPPSFPTLSRPLAPSRARSLPSCRPSCGKPCRYRREATGWLASDGLRSNTSARKRLKGKCFITILQCRNCTY